MSEATDRPHDRGRSHRRTRTAPAPATVPVLERYRAAMRDELADTLAELRPPPVDPTLPITFGQPAPKGRPPLADRLRLWDLAIKLGRELGQGEDLEPELLILEREPAAAQAPRLSPAARRKLGG